MNRNLMKLEITSGEGLYEVMSVMPENAEFIKPGRNYLSVNAEVGEALEDALLAGKKVTIDQGECDSTLSKKHNLTTKQFTIEEFESVEAAKREAIAKVNTHFTNFVASVSAVEVFGFVTSFAKLADAGYFITDENREEKYIEIIQSEDDNLLAALEEFLETKESLEKVYSAHSNLKEFQEKIQKVKTVEDVEEAAKGFIEE